MERISCTYYPAWIIIAWNWSLLYSVFSENPLSLHSLECFVNPITSSSLKERKGKSYSLLWPTGAFHPRSFGREELLGSTEKQLRLREVKALGHRDASADCQSGDSKAWVLSMMLCKLAFPINEGLWFIKRNYTHILVPETMASDDLPSYVCGGNVGAFLECLGGCLERDSGCWAGKSFPPSLWVTCSEAQGAQVSMAAEPSWRCRSRWSHTTCTRGVRGRMLLTLTAILRDTSRMVLRGGYSLPWDRCCSETSWAIC